MELSDCLLWTVVVGAGDLAVAFFHIPVSETVVKSVPTIVFSLYEALTGTVVGEGGEARSDKNLVVVRTGVVAGTPADKSSEDRKSNAVAGVGNGTED
jgi:hypothetical protein